MTAIINEIDVLLATTVFLIERDVTPYQFSIPRGKGIDTGSAKRLLLDAFQSVGREPHFVSGGPDILGISESEWWQIECKGSGEGKKQTQRNNFDRALASVVSYYEENASQLPENYQNAEPFIGLALPDTPQYVNELTKRVRNPLRKKLNLWILLYEMHTKCIRPISPTEDYALI